MTATTNQGSSSTSANDSARRGRLQSLMMVILFACCLGIFYWVSNEAQSDTATAQNVQVKKVIVDRKEDKANLRCSLICQERRKIRLETHNDVDILDHKQVLHSATAAKARLVTKMKKHYGDEHFTNIFVDKKQNTSNDEEVRYRGVDPISPEGGSVYGLHRKILMKLLLAQTELRKQESNLDGCDCINGDRAIGGELPTTNTTNYLNVNSTYSQFNWMTGGHSASAGHGNLYNESYTAFLERGMKDVFASIGINFIGRNYAMGGTSSGMEISMCSEAVFGTDSDFLSWDYGMTDGRDYTRLLHYTYRASLFPGRPIFLGLNFDTQRYNQFKTMEDLGMSTFWVDPHVRDEMFQAIPDTSGMSEAAISAMPDMIRNFKCSGQIEKGDPFCSKEKYNEFVCPVRKGKASWHPGVKAHALDGNRIGLFLAQMVTDALEEYVQRESHPKPEDLLAELLVEEDLVYKEFKMAPLPELAQKMKEGDGVIPEDIDVETFFRGPNICKTGRTPAQTRYLGILTDTDKVGGVAPQGHETYEVGIEMATAIQSDANGEMRLIYESSDRENQGCPVVVKPDYKDSFFADGSDGWVKLVFPNKAEKRYYNYDPAKMKGIVIIFLGGCAWGKCKPNDLHIAEFDGGEFEFEVNGKKVTTLSHLPFGGREGYILKGDDGVNWPLNNEGQIELRTRVNNPTGYVRLSSVVLY